MTNTLALTRKFNSIVPISMIKNKKSALKRPRHRRLFFESTVDIFFANIRLLLILDMTNTQALTRQFKSTVPISTIRIISLP
jgi:hypothetical protein